MFAIKYCKQHKKKDSENSEKKLIFTLSNYFN